MRMGRIKVISIVLMMIIRVVVVVLVEVVAVNVAVVVAVVAIVSIEQGAFVRGVVVVRGEFSLFGQQVSIAEICF